jgi:hypothetical protein
MSHPRLLVGHPHVEAPFPPARRRVYSTFYLKASLLVSMWESTMNKRFVHTGSTLTSSSSSWRRIKRHCSLNTTSSTLPSARLWIFPPPPNFYNPWEIYDDTSMMYGAPPADIDDEDFDGSETDDDDDDSPPAAHSPHDYDD